TYSVTMSSTVDGVTTDLAGPQEFQVADLGINTFAADDPAAARAFQQKTWDLERAVRGALRWAGEAESRLAHTRKALYDTPGADTAMLAGRPDETAKKCEHAAVGVEPGVQHRRIPVGHYLGADRHPAGRLPVGRGSVFGGARAVEGPRLRSRGLREPARGCRRTVDPGEAAQLVELGMRNEE
ncbi:MAG: hypothetical protein P8127_12770, partial [Acidobacteriota bacterium]